MEKNGSWISHFVASVCGSVERGRGGGEWDGMCLCTPGGEVVLSGMGQELSLLSTGGSQQGTFLCMFVCVISASFSSAGNAALVHVLFAICYAFG